MTLDEVNRLFVYWQKYPPLRDLVAAFIGFKMPDPEAEKKYLTSDDIKQLIKMRGANIRV